MGLKSFWFGTKGLLEKRLRGALKSMSVGLRDIIKGSGFGFVEMRSNCRGLMFIIHTYKVYNV